MIGDNLDADIRGAQKVSLDAIFFNIIGIEQPTDISYMIKDLSELQEFFLK